MITSSMIPKPGFSPINFQDRPLGWKLAAIVVGSLFLTLSSYIEVPMVPVPVTMQTFAVALVGALYGWRLGGVTIVAWLVQGALGLPVLAGGAAGALHFMGPTGGYLFAFPVAGMAVGWLAERGWNGHRPWLAFAGMLIGNGLCLILGGAWLAVLIGVKQAIMAGIAPFLIGAVLKAGLGALTLKLMTRGVRHTA